jgi:hypothetical protein
MAIITIRVPDKLRKNMRKFRTINWSSAIRKATEDRIMLEQSREKRDKALLLEAGEEMDRIFLEHSKKNGASKYNSAVTIRAWRDARSKGMS